MKVLSILFLCLLFATKAYAQVGCSDEQVLQRYEDVRDFHVPAIDGLSAAEVELINTAYGAIQSGVVEETVRRTGVERYGVNMLMPILANAGNILKTTSIDPSVRLEGATGILNNTAWLFIQAVGMDGLLRDMMHGLQGEHPVSPGMMQDRLNRKQLEKTMESKGCDDWQNNLQEYQSSEYQDYSYWIPDVFAITNLCKAVDYSPLFSQLDEYEVAENEQGLINGYSLHCTSPVAREVVDIGAPDYTARSNFAVSAYGSVAEAINVMNGIRLSLQEFDGGEAGLFADEVVGYYQGIEAGIGSGSARRTSWHRSRNAVVRIDLSISSHYSNTPRPAAPSLSAEKAIVGQAFSLVHEGDF